MTRCRTFIDNKLLGGKAMSWGWRTKPRSVVKTVQ